MWYLVRPIRRDNYTRLSIEVSFDSVFGLGASETQGNAACFCVHDVQLFDTLRRVLYLVS